MASALLPSDASLDVPVVPLSEQLNQLLVPDSNPPLLSNEFPVGGVFPGHRSNARSMRLKTTATLRKMR